MKTQALALIDDILQRFHEAHRRDLPGIVALARELETRGAAPGLTDALQRMAQVLEQHMFKEEMRLFPMMEQGGNTLITHLIDDMRAEHVAQAAEVAALQAQVAALQAPAAAAPVLAALRQALAAFFDDLAQHMHAEDERLFPMFETGA